MMFQSILAQFQNLPSGTDAFKQLKNDCEQQLQSAESALEHTALFLVYGFAKNYVLLYEDQANTTEFSKTSKAQLIGYMQQLNQALLTQDKATVLDAVNQVTFDYMQSTRIF